MRPGDYFDVKPWGVQLAAVVKSKAEALELARRIEREARRLFPDPPPVHSMEGKGGYWGYKHDS